jgi:hypothetical protein
MNTILKGLAAGFGAKLLGFGFFGSIIAFIVIWSLLGHCN